MRHSFPPGPNVTPGQLMAARVQCYFSLSAAFAIPALAHAASLSPPGAPLTATAPMVIPPAMIGTAPWAFIAFPKKRAPGLAGGGAGVPGGVGVGPEGRP